MRFTLKPIFARLSDRLFWLQYQLQHRLSKTTQTCPRRMLEPGPWEHKPGLDYWKTVGPDRACSFCGSMHPDDFKRLVEESLTNEAIRIEPAAGKDYKIYIHRPEIQDAGMGAIKFYTHHMPIDHVWIGEFTKVFPRAVQLGHERFLREVASWQNAKGWGKN